MRIGILTGGGDVPGLNACIKAVVNRVAGEGHEVVGVRRGWGGLAETNADDPASGEANLIPLDPGSVRTIDRTGGTFLHSSRTNPAKVRPSEMPRLPGRRVRRRWAPRHHPARAEGPRAASNRRPDPDRRGRHAFLRAAAPRGGGAGHRHPEDHGQRRPRDRLLHRLLHRRESRGPVHPQPPHRGRLPRAGRGGRAVRPLQR